MKNAVIVVVGAVFLLLAWLIFSNDITKSPPPNPIAVTIPSNTPVPADPLNSIYYLDGKEITFVNGRAEDPNLSDVGTRAFYSIIGKPVTAHINADTMSDYALLITKDSSGSATAYYLAVGIGGGEGEAITGTNGILIGEQITPEKIDVSNQVIKVSFMANKKTVSSIKSYTLKDNKLVDEQDTDTGALKMCKNNNGEWSEAYRECGGIDKKTCESMGGVFDECASACRHDPNATMCTMQCVVICKF